MKALIAAACLCIIGLTAWIGYGEYRKHQFRKDIAFQTKCNNLTNEAWVEANYPSRYPESNKRLLRDIDKCLGL